MPAEGDDFWVFGYGSLMWRPGFAFVERQLATVRGYHRALCVYSHVHRGTPDRPGLVLGLDRGGACRGVAFHVAGEKWAETIAYLRGREQVTLVYREARVPVLLIDGRRVSALTFVVDRAHAQYAGRLEGPMLLQHVRQGVGRSGSNPDYIRATHDHLVELGLRDRTLAWLAAHLD
ncbi:MAG: gamma-glutamylcyclotransferase [Methylobacteriaceae bacterium]|nr:gamma-glutamylcyclotransferase [Methylobacteriaceae bacterium]